MFWFSVALSLSGPGSLYAWLTGVNDFVGTIGGYLIMGTSLRVLWLLRQDRVEEALPWFLYGLATGSLISVAQSDPRDAFSTSPGLMVLVILTAFMASSVAAYRMAAVCAVALAAAYLGWYRFDPDTQLVIHFLWDEVRVLMAVGLVVAFFRGIERDHEVLSERLRDVELVRERAHAIAAGDLHLHSPSEGGASDVELALGHTVGALRKMMQGIQRASEGINHTATRIRAGSDEIGRGATEQAAAVEQTQTILATLDRSAQRIATTAEHAVEHTAHNRRSLEHIDAQTQQLIDHLRSIEDVVDQMRDLARKSEILALNAALEGQRIQQQGGDFQSVAQRMAQLSERSSEALASVQHLTEDIRATSRATSEATEEARLRADQSAKSALHIQGVTLEQQAAFAEVGEAIRSVLEVSRHTRAEHDRTLSRTEDLLHLSVQLRQLTAEFRL